MSRFAAILALACLTSNSSAADLSDYLTGELATLERPTHPVSLAAHSITYPDGQRRPLADKRGKVLLVNLWDRGCVPCKEEMPDLAALQRDLGDERFEVIALPMSKSSLRSIRKTLKAWGAAALTPFRNDPQGLAGVLYKEGLFTEKTIAFVYPTTYLVDKQGRILAIREGFFDWDTPEVRALITALKKDAL